jgi:hypothetical protein
MTMRTGLHASLLSILLVSLATMTAEPAIAGNPVGDFFCALAAGSGNACASAAAADGMQLLARLMEQNGYDRQRAWMAFAQSSEGQRIMRVPGALSLLTDWFNAVMALPSGPNARIDPARTQHPSEAPRHTNQTDEQSANPVEGEVAGRPSAPFLGPYRPNAYGLGINSDAAGRPFVWQTDQGTSDPLAKVRPDVFGPGVGMDQYGRPVRAACPEFQPNC